MKSQTQLIILLVVFGALVGGLTFVRQWVVITAPQEKEINPLSEFRVDYPRTMAIGDPEVEYPNPGHFDFWFRNGNATAADIGLELQSCKCSKVELLVLTPEEEKIVHEESKGAAAAVVGGSAGSLANWFCLTGATVARTAKFLGDSDRWKRLDKGEGSAVEVPADATGFVRLSWQAKQLGAVRLVAKVWAQAHGQPKTRGGLTSLEVPVVYVPALRVTPGTVKIPELATGGAFTAELYCFSATRASFEVKAYEKSKDPCVTCTCTRLAGDEFLEAAAKVTTEAKSIPLSIYLVEVTISERLPSGSQMELGPFEKVIAMESNLVGVEPVLATCTGIVRGDVTVGTSDDRDRIVLKTFRADRGYTMTVPVETTVPGLDLTIDAKIPSYLVADLKERAEGGIGKRWDLTVTVPPNVTEGKLPADSAIVLKTRGNQPRKIRIPILGKAVSSLDQ
jgi:hypothetical protein